MPLPSFPIRRDARPGDEDHESDYQSGTGWWERTPTTPPAEKK
jgi:hypothetical protein